jgi:hypothetical protein
VQSVTARLRYWTFNLAAIGALVGACSGRQVAAQNQNTPGVVAGYGEKSFAERYRLAIKLPMPETQFLAIVQKLGLYYQTCGERGSDLGVPPPRQKTSIDLSKAKKCYEIDGDRDVKKHTAEAWRAFTDSKDQVIYIENAFVYTGT